MNGMKQQEPRLWCFHKPDGLVVSLDEPAPGDLKNEISPALPIGNLDNEAEGLLMLTNDAQTLRLLELAAGGWVRHYRVLVAGKPDAKALASLQAGITIEGVPYGPIEAQVEKGSAKESWIGFAIREGRNRDIRKVCTALKLKVKRLVRTSFGPFQLGALKKGRIEEVPPNVFKEQLGGRAAANHADHRGKVQGA